jgi:CDP-diacylglycerol---serine O-phosphatidyltransferase
MQTMLEVTARKHFSMIRSFHLADLFTIANGVSGATAIFQAMKYLGTDDARHLFVAGVLILVALVCDVFDGWIARWRHAASAMGRELDSLADVISFGVAPAAVAFAAGANTWLDQAILLFFTACGLSRLARFNVTAESLSDKTGKVEYFEGTPIPTSVVPLGILMLAFYMRNLYPMHLFGVAVHAVVLPFLVSGSLMISKTLRIPKP